MWILGLKGLKHMPTDALPGVNMKSSTRRMTISASCVSASPVCPDTLMSCTAPCKQSSRRRLSTTRGGITKDSAEEMMLTAAMA